jgi:hypothetical protein
MNKPLCPCCSQRLLLHISFKRNYWFCTQCHQEMPDLNNLVKTELTISHWVSNKITERLHLAEEWQPSTKQYPASTAIKKLERLAF